MTDEERRLAKNEYNRQYRKDTKNASVKKYSKENVKKITWGFNRTLDADILQKLEDIGKGNKLTYIKHLIREDIRKS